jgi:biotin synthase-related radical SAM superfamily protein
LMVVVVVPVGLAVGLGERDKGIVRFFLHSASASCAQRTLSSLQLQTTLIN